MANIRIDVDYTIKDGTELVFRSPCDCTEVTGLIVYYATENGTASMEFALADAHGENVGDIPHLFVGNVVVKVILDVSSGMAFVQNADTNAYLEAQFAGKAPIDHTHTASDVGAAPAGYGLGGNLTKITADDINTLHNGWYRITNTSITVAGWTASDWYIHVIRYAETYCIQHWYPLSAHKMEIVRWCVDGTWYEEWVNPPMVLGTE